jgi:hypothetical protein
VDAVRLRRKRTEQQPVPVANPTRIAVLEHDLLGVTPKPGTAAAAVIALRSIGTCIEHDPIDVGTLGQIPGTSVICGRCGNHLVNTESGWRLAGEEGKP